VTTALPLTTLVVNTHVVTAVVLSQREREARVELVRRVPSQERGKTGNIRVLLL
jgi:hypothetical protein